jgi:hypothetical protein
VRGRTGGHTSKEGKMNESTQNGNLSCLYFGVQGSTRKKQVSNQNKSFGNNHQGKWSCAMEVIYRAYPTGKKYKSNCERF